MVLYLGWMISSSYRQARKRREAVQARRREAELTKPK